MRPADDLPSMQVDSARVPAGFLLRDDPTVANLDSLLLKPSRLRTFVAGKEPTTRCDHPPPGELTVRTAQDAADRARRPGIPGFGRNLPVGHKVTGLERIEHLRNSALKISPVAAIGRTHFSV